MVNPKNGKHAYLIMAHNNFSQLQQLIALLDHPRNDIYLHVDKKAHSFYTEDIKTMYSKLHIIKRIHVNWGGHSQIKCELNLLKAAASGHYLYYHLLSGSDLPLKSQAEIHSFFDQDPSKNYIGFDRVANDTGSFKSRIQFFYLFQDLIGRQPGRIIAIMERLEHLSISIQKKLGIYRKQYVSPYKGDQWFSINDSLAQYILDNERIIKKQFFFSICADEIFLQSMAMSSPFRDSIINHCLRAIDWNRGTPYTYKYEDVTPLLHSPSLFARKFDSKTDPVAVNAIIAHLNQK